MIAIVATLAAIARYAIAISATTYVMGIAIVAIATIVRYALANVRCARLAATAIVAIPNRKIIFNEDKQMRTLTLQRAGVLFYDGLLYDFLGLFSFHYLYPRSSRRHEITQTQNGGRRTWTKSRAYRHVFSARRRAPFFCL